MIPTVGKSLIARRRELGLTLDDVAHASRVSRQNLRWLEADEFGQFPSPAYALAFLRFYGGVLGMEVGALAALARRQVALRQEARTWAPRIARVVGKPGSIRARSLARLGTVLAAAALSVILAAAGLAVMGHLTSPERGTAPGGMPAPLLSERPGVAENSVSAAWMR